jgi:hypothetical protein
MITKTLIQYDQNEVPIADLNNKTLNEVFANPTFKYDYTSSSDRIVWTDDNTATETYDYANGIFIASSDRTSTFYGYSTTFLDNAKTYYLISSIKPLQQTEWIYIGFSTGTSTDRKYIYNPTPNVYSTYTLKGSPVNQRLDYVANIAAIGDTIHMDYFYIIDLTALGITATQEQLDFWYNVWLENNKLGMRLHRESGNDVTIYTRNLSVDSTYTGNIYNREGYFFDNWEVGNTYVASGNFTKDQVFGNFVTLLALNDSNTELATYSDNSTGGQSGSFNVFLTVPSGTTKLLLGFGTSAIRSGSFSNIQLELGTTSTPYIAHSFTLNEVFRDGDLVPEFIDANSNNIADGWTLRDTSATNLSVSNNTQFITSSTGGFSGGFFNGTSSIPLYNIPSSTKIYIRATLTNIGTIVANGSPDVAMFTGSPITANSFLYTTTSTFNGLEFRPAIAGATIIKDVMLLNLNTLGLQSLTKSQLDYYFNQWQFNNANATLSAQFVQSSGIDTVAYLDKTYREIFEGGNLIPNNTFDTGVSGWTATGGINPTVSYGNQFLITSRDNGTPYVRPQANIAFVQNNKYFIATDLKVGVVLDPQDVLITSFTNVIPTQTLGTGITSNWKTFSNVVTAVETGNVGLSFFVSVVGASYTEFHLDNVYTINLTSMFGSGNEPNNETMEALLRVYKIFKGVR